MLNDVGYLNEKQIQISAMDAVMPVLRIIDCIPF